MGGNIDRSEQVDLGAAQEWARVATLRGLLYKYAGGNRRSAARSDLLGKLGILHHSLGEVCQAIEYYEQALQIAREIGDRRGEASTSWNLGLLYEDSDPARAAELMQVCVDYERDIGHPDADADAARVEELWPLVRATDAQDLTDLT